MGNKCCICGRSIGLLNTYHRSFHGRSLETCMFCIEALEQVDSGKTDKTEKGIQYLRSEMAKGIATPEASLMVRETIKEISGEEASEKLASIPVSSADDAVVSSNAPLLAGAAFFVLAIILYFVSINNSYGVANIQATVYSAASFVAAIVCFAASRIVEAVNSRK